MSCYNCGHDAPKKANSWSPNFVNIPCTVRWLSAVERNWHRTSSLSTHWQGATGARYFASAPSPSYDPRPFKAYTSSLYSGSCQCRLFVWSSEARVKLSGGRFWQRLSLSAADDQSGNVKSLLHDLFSSFFLILLLPLLIIIMVIISSSNISNKNVWRL